MATLWESVKEKLGVVLVTGVVAVATIFSDHITAGIRSEVNKADQRPVQQEKIAKDMSTLLFTAENFIEFATDGLTSKTELHFVVDPYNVAIETWRKNEYLYLSSVSRYWDKSTADTFQKFLTDARALDKSLHRMNPLFAPVDAGAKAKADQASVAPLATAASAALQTTQDSAKALFSGLAK